MYRCIVCLSTKDVDPNTNLCARCDAKIMIQITDYIREHPGSNAREISKNTKININIITSLIDSGRINYLLNPNEKKSCKKCKIDFYGDGFLCESCAKEYNLIGSELSKLYKEKEELVEKRKSQSAKMHISGFGKK